MDDIFRQHHQQQQQQRNAHRVVRQMAARHQLRVAPLLPPVVLPPPVELTEEEKEKRREFNKKLRGMYPQIKERDSGLALPRRWDPAQASPWLELTDDGLGVTFITQEHQTDMKEAHAIVRADAAIPSMVGFYYFEVTILETKEKSLGIGLSKKDGQLSRMPGWDPGCYGYHGDDGYFFNASGVGVPYGPKFSTNDVIGCGIDTLLKQIFFTKNGRHLGNISNRENRFVDLWPTVGLKTPGEKLKVNFGQEPFVFDTVAHKEKLDHKKFEFLEMVPMPEDHLSNINRMISSFLAFNGSVETLKKFEKYQHLPKDEKYNSEFLNIRRKLVDMVMKGSPGCLIQKELNTHFPDLLKDNPIMRLMILCLRFIDITTTIRSDVESFRDKKNDVDAFSPTLSNRAANSCVVSPASSVPSPHMSMNRRDKNGQAKKSARNHEEEQMKNGDSCKYVEIVDEDSGEKLYQIEQGLVVSKAMYNELTSKDDYKKMMYIIDMAREIFNLAANRKLKNEERTIVEMSLARLMRTDEKKHVLSKASKRYISNLMVGMLNAFTTDKKIKQNTYSELHGLFYGWKSIHQDIAYRDDAPASITFVKKMVTTGMGPRLPRETTFQDEKMEMDEEKEPEEIEPKNESPSIADDDDEAVITDDSSPDN